MPQPVMERTEKLLLQLAFDYEKVHMQAFDTQTSVATKINNAYNKQGWIAFCKPLLEIGTKAGYYALTAKNPTWITERLNLKPEDTKTAFEFYNTITGSVISLCTDASSVSNQSEQTRLGSVQQQLQAMVTSQSSAKQQLDGIISKFQNLESSARQAGG